MTEYRTRDIDCKTLGELISKHYSDYRICFGTAPEDMDITHGVEIETYDNTRFGHGVTVNIYPYIEWSDGCYKPCHYWGSKYYVTLQKG